MSPCRVGGPKLHCHIFLFFFLTLSWQIGGTARIRWRVRHVKRHKERHSSTTRRWYHFAFFALWKIILSEGKCVELPQAVIPRSADKTVLRNCVRDVLKSHTWCLNLFKEFQINGMGHASTAFGNCMLPIHPPFSLPRFQIKGRLRDSYQPRQKYTFILVKVYNFRVSGYKCRDRIFLVFVTYLS